jgi:predicted Zn-dependent protease
VVRSFGPLSAAGKRSIEEKRLRTARALSGENLVAVSKRTGNAWNIQETAVMNGLFANAQLDSGQLIKVAIPERYAK